MKKKIIIIGGIVLLAVGFGVYKYTYQSHRDISSEEAAFVITVDELHQKFVNDETNANTTYLDKTIEIKGIITAIDTTTNTIVLNEKLFGMLMDNNLTNVSLNREATIKGRLLGYDELLEELKFDQVTIK